MVRIAPARGRAGEILAFDLGWAAADHGLLLLCWVLLHAILVKNVVLVVVEKLATLRGCCQRAAQETSEDPIWLGDTVTGVFIAMVLIAETALEASWEVFGDYSLAAVPPIPANWEVI